MRLLSIRDPINRGTLPPTPCDRSATIRDRFRDQNDQKHIPFRAYIQCDIFRSAYIPIHVYVRPRIYAEPYICRTRPCLIVHISDLIYAWQFILFTNSINTYWLTTHCNCLCVWSWIRINCKLHAFINLILRVVYRVTRFIRRIEFTWIITRIIVQFDVIKIALIRRYFIWLFDDIWMCEQCDCNCEYYVHHDSTRIDALLLT
jgi:hypothetical protein